MIQKYKKSIYINKIRDYKVFEKQRNVSKYNLLLLLSAQKKLLIEKLFFYNVPIYSISCITSSSLFKLMSFSFMKALISF